ncbi:MAG TPA: proline-rich domain-containing protein [Polyangiaceae bacterium]|nr:proline-rich domain-containing protein [Polyangiaceae bacterium]
MSDSDVEKDDAHEVDGLLDSLTQEEYRDEQATLPFNAETMPPPGGFSVRTPPSSEPPPRDVPTAQPAPFAPRKTPPIPPRPARLPLPGAGVPRPGAPAAPKRDATRPPARPVPKPAKGLPDGEGIDDSEIDAALMSLSGHPAAPTTPPTTAREAVAPLGLAEEEEPDEEAPPPLPAMGDRDGAPSAPRSPLPPDPDSWLPPAFDNESLDDLEAVEVEEPTMDYDPLLDAAPSLARLAADLTAGGEKEDPDAPVVEATAGVEALDAELDHWEEDRTTSIPEPGATGKPVAPSVAVSAAPASVEVGLETSESDVDALLEMSEPPVTRQADTTPAPASAVARLGGNRLIDAWVARAEWFEAEAQATSDVKARARLLLAASELWAMAGNLPRSRDSAGRATAAWPSLSLASRQARALAAVQGDWKTVAEALDVENRTAQNDAARAHASYLAAEVQRVALGDAEAAERRLDTLARVAPDDPRPYLSRLAAELGRTSGPLKPAPKDAKGFAPFAEAHAELSRLRAPGSSDAPPSDVVAFNDATRALDSGDRVRAGAAIDALRDVPGIGDGALLLSSALYAPSSETRGKSIELLRLLLTRDQSDVVRRALASRALEQGDKEAMAVALSSEEAEDTAFDASDRVALGALTGADAEALAEAARAISGDVALRPLAAAASSASSVDLPAVPVGEPATFARIALGRKLALASSLDDLRDAVHALRAAEHDAELGRVLSLELEAGAGATTAVATELGKLAPADAALDGKLAAALIEEAAGRVDAARRHYTGVLGSPERAESAARAMVTPGDAGASDLLAMLASSLGEETTARQSLLLYEAAIRSGLTDVDAADELLGRAHEAAPSLPFAARLGSDLARARSDVPKLLEWLRKQQIAATDPMGRALGAVREALLIADDDPAGAAACLAAAVVARPDDVALRELEGRLSPAPNASRAEWRERAVETTDHARTKVWLSHEAANEYRRADAEEDAKRLAIVAANAGDSALAALLAQRRTGADEHAPPAGLAASRAAEQRLLAEGSEEELEALATSLVDLLDRGEALAHARLAARLRVKTLDWPSTRELVEHAVRHKPASLWALRQASAHARFAGDDARVLETDRELAARAERPLDRATLSLRAAEAAARLGKWDEALALLETTLELAPGHLVARELRAYLEEQTGKYSEAAEDLEALTRSLSLREHQADAWYRAAILWGDKVDDPARYLTALERVAALDIVKGDVFERLQQQYVRSGERAKLAELLEARLARTTVPEERVALEVTRGRALADVGERDAARRALGAALEANPDHADALEAYGSLALAEGEWKRAEETWIRLARVVTAPEKQAEIYGRLAALYDEELPNPQRAEICYREILKRRPNDPAATLALVKVYGRLGDVVKAVQLQTELVDRATAPEEKRPLMLALADVYDEIAKDKRSALTILEKARKAWPHEPGVLRSLARHYERHGETPAQNVLLDRAAAEARRALSHGRFDLSFFGVLETVADLRGQADVASVTRATLAALEGREEVAVPGGGAAATATSLDDLVAPELLSPALRALLSKLPSVLDTAYPADLKALRASALPPSAAELGGEIRAVAESMGVRSVELLVTPLLGSVFLPASSKPARLLVGQSLLDSTDERARYFLLVRALKMIESDAAALSRIAPIELSPVLGALLSGIASNWQAPGIDPTKLADARRRIEPALPTARDPELGALALEIAGSIGNRASQLGQAVAQWASRTALLAVGSPSLALRGVAIALGQTEGMPSDVSERLKWVQRQPEARDLCVFSVSENYAEARRRLGLGG